MQVTCTSSKDNNPCFTNPNNPKYKAIQEMIKGELYLLSEPAITDGSTRLLEEESNLRGANRRLNCVNCSLLPKEAKAFCGIFPKCGGGRMLEEPRDLQEATDNVCFKDLTLSTFLVDFPGKAINSCWGDDVECVLEYVC